MRFAFVEEHCRLVPVERLCRMLKVTSRGFRAWRERPVSQRQRDDLVLLAHIREHHHLSLGSYGRPRMTQELKEAGLRVGHRRVGRLMRSNGIGIVRTCKYKATTDSNHHFSIAPNWLGRNFHADQANQKWAGDITYIWTAEGWLYLAVMIDLHSRRVIGWATSNRLKRDLALRALNNAVALRNPQPGCLHHTDRGSQYCSHNYQNRLRELGLKVSMSGRGNCYDNAAVETFFKTLKAELIWRHTWATRQQVSNALFQYINHCLTGDVYIAEKGLLQHPPQTLSHRRYITRQVRTKNSLNENGIRN